MENFKQIKSKEIELNLNKKVEELNNKIDDIDKKTTEMVNDFDEHNSNIIEFKNKYLALIDEKTLLKKERALLSISNN